MLNKISFTKMLLLIVAMSAVLFSGYQLMAQTPAEGEFINNSGGTYKVGNVAGKKGGIIRMKGSASADGAFKGTAQLGTNQATRIPGTVIWAKNDDQKVQGGWYTNLGVAEPTNSTTDHKRTFGATANDTSYYVSGDFQRYGNTLRATPLTDAQAIKFRGSINVHADIWKEISASTTVPVGVSRVPFIDHTCASDFWYDGTAMQMVLGTILTPASGSTNPQDNYYAHLRQYNHEGISLGSFTQTQVFQQMAASSIHTPTTISNGPLHVSPSYPLSILLATVCNIPDTTIIDTTIVDTCGNPAWEALHPDIVCNTTPKPCDTCDPCSAPALYTGPDIVINITGGIAYDGKDAGKNIPFCFYSDNNCETTARPGSEPTRVIYHSGADGIYPAHYGILEIAADRTTDISLLGNVYIKGKRPYALDHKSTANVITGANATTLAGLDKRIVFEEACAQPTYSACGEVVGWIYRAGTAINGTYSSHRYHNTLTEVGFDYTSNSVQSVPFDADGGDHQWFGLLSIPNVTVGSDARSKAKDPGTEYGYISRVWQVDFATSNTNSYIKTMNLGNAKSEIQPKLVSNWASMRGYEVWDAQQDPTLLVGVGANPWGPRQTGAVLDTTGVQWGTVTACNIFAMRQTEKMILTAGTDPSQGQLDDIYPNSQIVFGNVPTTVQSVRNGRWSNPATWGGMTPQREDSVVLWHLVYTGIYDNTYNGQILGTDQFSRNEHNLPGVKDPVTDSVILAKYVNIKSEADCKFTDGQHPTAKNATGKAGLIIGNHETAGAFPDGAKDPEGTAMDWDKVLTFGTIENHNAMGVSLDPEANPANSLTFNLLKTATIDFGGLYLMGTSTPATGETIAPIAGTWIFLNSGSFVNEAILEIGK